MIARPGRQNELPGSVVFHRAGSNPGKQIAYHYQRLSTKPFILKCEMSSQHWCLFNSSTAKWRSAMDDPGFERRVQEGMAALERSRECLRTHRDKPPSWEKITPESLQPAIKYISRE